MFEGICKLCGTHFFGNALYREGKRICTKCGGPIIIIDNCQNKQIEQHQEEINKSTSALEAGAESDII